MLRRKFFGVMLSLAAAPLAVGCTHKKDESKSAGKKKINREKDKK